jgi:carbohydrate-binding DOMON domain-containing protein
MRLRTIAFATAMVLASASFTASFAQSSAVSEKSFDWIFFAIIGIPFVLGVVALLMPNLLEPLIREWPWDRRRKE